MKRLPMLICLLLIPAYLLNLAVPGIGGMHDDAIYVALGKALRLGKGYVLESVPGEPAQTKYPPLYPWLLALVWKAWSNYPANAIPLKSISVLAGAGWLWLAYLCGRKCQLSQEQCWWVIAMLGAHQWTLYLTTNTMSDTTFAFLSLGCVYVASNMWEKPHIIRWSIVTGLAVGGACLTRSAGMSLLAAIGVVLAAARLWMPLSLFVTCAGVFVAGWKVWQTTRPIPEDPVLVPLTHVNYASWWAFHLNAGDAFLVVIMNFISAMCALPLACRMNAEVLPLLAIAGCGMLWLAIKGCFKEKAPQYYIYGLWLIISVGMACMWTWQPGRFMFPMFPLLLILAAKAVCPLQTRMDRVIAGLLIGAFLITSGYQMVRSVSLGRTYGMASFYGSRPLNWNAMVRVGEWLKANTPEDSIHGSVLATPMALLSGRKTVQPFVLDPVALLYRRQKPPLGSADEVFSHVKRMGIKYLVLMESESSLEEPLFREVIGEVMRMRPGLLRVVYADEVPGYIVYRVEE